MQIRPGADGVMQAKVRDNGFDLALLVRSLLEQGYDGWIASEYVWMEKWRCDEVDNTGESGHGCARPARGSLLMAGRSA